MAEPTKPAEPRFSQGVTLQTSLEQRDPIIMALIWGSSGFGKTTLAATLPGKKLLLNFDPGGQDAISNRIGVDVDVLDFSATTKEIVNDFKSADNPLNLKPIIGNYDSVILDSLTTIAERTTEYGISITNGATLERPSPGAYGARNALLLALIQSIMRLCVRNGVHLAAIAHEAAPEKDDKGVVQSITVALGGQLPQNTALRFSEVYGCFELGVSGNKFIGIRNGARMRRPCKSRIFDTRAQSEMPWKFDPTTLEGDTLEGWHNAWVANGYQKIAPTKG